MPPSPFSSYTYPPPPPDLDGGPHTAPTTQNPNKFAKYGCKISIIIIIMHPPVHCHIFIYHIDRIYPGSILGSIHKLYTLHGTVINDKYNPKNKRLAPPPPGGLPRHALPRGHLQRPH